MPSEPVLYQALEALEVHLKAESEADRISPRIARITESTDWTQLEAYPTVICMVTGEAAFQKDPCLMTGVLTLRACILEERPDSAQREMLHFVHELRKAINRKDSYAGAILIYRKGIYKRSTKGDGILHHTDIEFEANYREKATER